MRRGLGNYVRKGLGGSRAATARMGRTVINAGALFNALTNIAAGQGGPPGSTLDPALLAGRSADEIMDAVVEAVRPIDGTLDAEAEQRAVRTALAEVLDRFPDADLLNLTEEQRLFVIENYAALDVFEQFALALERTIKARAPSCTTAMARLREVKDYIKSTVSARMREHRTTGKKLDARRISETVRQALQETFEVFEEYAT